MNKLKPFRYWVQKVLPEIYDDSLSYYELLNKVVSYLNTAMDNVNTLSENVTSIYNTVVELQEYVSEHLDEAIEEAIDEYFRTHTFVGSVTVEQNVSEGVKIGSVNVDGVITELFCPETGGVSVDQVVTSGVEIAGVTVGSVRTPIFAVGVSATADVHSGTKIGDITIGEEVVEFYAPDGSGVSFTPTLTTGVEIGVITIGGNSIRMFAPSGGGGSGAVDSVNGKIGDVVLTAEDVGARSDTWMPTAQEVGARSDTWMPTAQEVGARADTWMPTAQEVGALSDTVTALPNPNKLTFTGAVSAEYDGSSEVTVNIPRGGSEGGTIITSFNVLIPPTAWEETTSGYSADIDCPITIDYEHYHVLDVRRANPVITTLDGDKEFSKISTAILDKNSSKIHLNTFIGLPAPTSEVFVCIAVALNTETTESAFQLPLTHLPVGVWTGGSY